MPTEKRLTSSRLVQLSRGTAVLIFLLGGNGSFAADATIGASACAVLKAVLPQVKGFKPEGARAQLVMAVGEKFDYDPNRLRTVRAEVDSATSASCPKEREAWLSILRMKSLREALS